MFVHLNLKSQNHGLLKNKLISGDIFLMSYPDMYFIKKKEEPLSQGDIFSRFDDKIIPKSEEEELGFIILTYTYDLEHPDDLSYILFCPVLDFDILIKKYLEINKNKKLTNINEMLMSKVNNIFSNDNRYHFFLSPIPKVCKNPAFAHLEQITKISKKYMDNLLKNRKISLKKPWREKLGWMVGNLFNRIALKDIEKNLPSQYIQSSDSFKIFIEIRCNQIKNSLIVYLEKDNEISNILKDKILPIFLEHDKTTRDMIKTKLTQTHSDVEIEKILETLTSEINERDNDFLRDIIIFEKKHHKLDNFSINVIFKSIINEVFDSLSN